MHLGAGRLNLNDKLDYGAGIILNKKVGDKVNVGDVLMTLYTSKEFNPENISIESFLITDEPPKLSPLIYQIME